MTVESPDGLDERWVVRLLVTRKPGDEVPTQWNWEVADADVVVLGGGVVGAVAPVAAVLDKGEPTDG